MDRLRTVWNSLGGSELRRLGVATGVGSATGGCVLRLGCGVLSSRSLGEGLGNLGRDLPDFGGATGYDSDRSLVDADLSVGAGLFLDEPF